MKIAVVGAGISGLLCARLLCRDHDITVFEARGRIGGDTGAVRVTVDGVDYPVEFRPLVFSPLIFPDTARLLAGLGLSTVPCPADVSVKCEQSGLAYTSGPADIVFARRRNRLHPRFFRMTREIRRFRREGLSFLLHPDEQLTLHDYLTRHGYSDTFVRYWIIPFTGITGWEGADPVRSIPARFFIRFLQNRGFLHTAEAAPLRMIRDGSTAFLTALARPFRRRIRLRTPVRSVRRTDRYVELTFSGAETQRFHGVILAVPGEQALKLLADPSGAEQENLGAVRFRKTTALLHSDTAVLPHPRRVRAGWNFLLPRQSGAVMVTTDMNLLQDRSAPLTFCISHYHDWRVHPGRIIREIPVRQAVYTPEALRARKQVDAVSGVSRTWFCGAGWGDGFPEESVDSALKICRYFGKDLDGL